MVIELTEEQEAVRQAASEFARKELLPGVIERDEQQKFPLEQVKKMGELGFMGMMVHPDYNGGGMDTISYMLAISEIAAVDASAAVIMSVNNSLVCWGLEKYGREEQKAKYLMKLATGEILGAFCLSEPEAGSDATSQRTSAKDMGDYYLVNGTKNWITNGNSASVYIVFAQTNPELKHNGINALIIEKSWEGVTVGRKENKLGIRGSDTHSIMFSDVKVPKENRLADEGYGFKLAMKILSGGRIGIAAQALGIALASLDLSIRYAKERHAFGKAIAQHQAIQFKLSEMATKIEAAKLLCYQAAYFKDKGKDFTMESAMAKYFASETAMFCASEAIQIHGGYGYVKDYHVERFLRDAKITQIYEGTTEIQKIVISRELLIK